MANVKRETGFIPEWTMADRLRKARETTGMGVVEFSEKVGIGRGTVNNAERGHREPSRNTVRIWSLATGVSYEWLLNGTTPPPEDGEGVEYRAPSQIRTDDLFFKSRQLVIKRHHLRALQAA